MRRPMMTLSLLDTSTRSTDADQLSTQLETQTRSRYQLDFFRPGIRPSSAMSRSCIRASLNLR